MSKQTKDDEWEPRAIRWRVGTLPAEADIFALPYGVEGFCVVDCNGFYPRPNGYKTFKAAHAAAVRAAKATGRKAAGK